jgi:hypothetical protein
MIGSRLRIALLGGFFTFAFAMLFLALMQNNVRAENTELSSLFVSFVVHVVCCFSVFYIYERQKSRGSDAVRNC